MTTEFTEWSFPIEPTGAMLQLRIVLRSTSGIGNEVLAFDRVGLIGRKDVRPEDLLPLGGACNPIFGLADWFESPWFGDYNTTYAPWIFHGSHQFIYLDPGSTVTGLYFFDPVIDSWIYTDPSIYPYLYFYDGQGWMYFFTDTLARACFTATWISPSFITNSATDTGAGLRQRRRDGGQIKSSLQKAFGLADLPAFFDELSSG